jgi:hypothetical protein
VAASWPSGPDWPEPEAADDAAAGITTGRSTSSGADGANRPPRP